MQRQPFGDQVCPDLGELAAPVHVLRAIIRGLHFVGRHVSEHQLDDRVVRLEALVHDG